MSESPLLREVEGERKIGISSRWDALTEELKKVSRIALPMVFVAISQQLVITVAMMMLGHLGELSLSGAAIATSLTNVTGFSLLYGLSSGLETLCGQAYGARQYKKLSVYTNGAMIALVIVCIPISILWVFMDKLLILIGQDPLISVEARKYSIWLIPALFSHAILQPLVRYLQTQSLILPMLLSSVASLCFHVPVCWAFVFKLNLGCKGAALAIGLSYWLNVFLLGVYVRYSSSCNDTRISISFSKEVYSSIGEFVCLAIPSACMICLEWWTYEIVVLLSGLLPNPQLEASVLSICLMISSLHFFIPLSIGAGASTRISNELGAGNSEAARNVVTAVLVLSLSEAVIAITALLCSGRVLGFLFSNEKEVVDYIGKMVPFVCLLVVTDCIQSVLSGVVRGNGKQHSGAYINLGSFYLVGLPVASILGFAAHLNGKGLWIGLNIGAAVQSILLIIITLFTDWQKQADRARERIFDGN
ncbi:PREDICTED: protein DETOXIFICATION 12-like [Ipomoea nil]|uniref:protein DETOXIFICATION 12-like n=1 Tax=Ipomoea nil TaxID=35883 RepID=UPI000900D97F|nr:PREDICTED: protein DETOXIFICATION 12-like [Ipomoea nil]XP_019173065.1 PREDICTED: protein DETOXIFICATION 12-like [Ipomoea nil]